MDIRPLDVTDNVEYDAYYAIMRNGELHERSDAPFDSPRELRLTLSQPDPSEEITGYLGHDDNGRPVAAGFLALTLLDNTNIAFMQSTVSPPLRRRGFGGAMLEHLAGLARSVGRSVLLADAWMPPADREAHPYRRFLHKHGFSLANIEVRRVLPLPVPEDQLDAWAAASAPHHQGYRIESYVDEIPDRLLPSLCTAKNQLTVDAPTGDVQLEEQALTPEIFRERRKLLLEQGRTVYSTLAVDVAKEAAVAYTDLIVSADRPETVEQWGTLVHRDHRGHRLGTAVKAANLKALQAAHPAGTVVSTCNAETNGPMPDINIEMGFEPVEILGEFQRKVRPGD